MLNFACPRQGEVYLSQIGEMLNDKRKEIIMRLIQNSVFYIFCILITGCGVYSLKSGSIPPDIKSISIQNFINEAGGPSSLGQNLTEKIKSYYQLNSRLIIVKTDGDWRLEGRIISYIVSPVAPNAVAGQTGSSNLNRLTITVGAKFVNSKNEKENFETPFSFFSDFQQGQNLSQVESELVEVILNQIVIDIFNRTTSNW
jgi:hypothetical protein